jgi:hypothetical protein
VIVGKNTLERALPKMAKKSQKLQNRPKNGPKWSQIPIDYECSLAKMAQFVFLPSQFEEKNTTKSILLLNLLDSKNKQTNKQTYTDKQINIKIYRRKYINYTSRIHTFVLEEMQIRKPCQIKIAF